MIYMVTQRDGWSPCCHHALSWLCSPRGHRAELQLTCEAVVTACSTGYSLQAQELAFALMKAALEQHLVCLWVLLGVFFPPPELQHFAQYLLEKTVCSVGGK